jgi:hypothetical protein
MVQRSDVCGLGKVSEAQIGLFLQKAVQLAALQKFVRQEPGSQTLFCCDYGIAIGSQSTQQIYKIIQSSLHFYNQMTTRARLICRFQNESNPLWTRKAVHIVS